MKIEFHNREDDAWTTAEVQFMGRTFLYTYYAQLNSWAAVSREWEPAATAVDEFIQKKVAEAWESHLAKLVLE